MPFKSVLPPVLIGDRFTRLVVVEVGLRLGYQLAARCACDCGGERTCRVQSLREGLTKSCGCLNREVATAKGLASRKHNGRRKEVGVDKPSTTYISWAGMFQRCYNPKNKRYANYGGRGITVCARWTGKDGFVNFLADMGERPEGLTIDRKNNDGDYEPDNCKWSTWSEQNSNRNGWTVKRKPTPSGDGAPSGGG